MIKTVAELLKAFVDEEKAKLDVEELTHGPTIGSMYEGLTKETIERSLPDGLDLQVVSGFTYFGDKTSGQLDCMLVHGEGRLIPYTDVYHWHIKDVIAVFEVKKTLSEDELADSFNHLREVSELYSTYFQSGETKDVSININQPRRVFSQITGVVAPEHGKVEQLPFDLEMIYHTLICEFISPVRIVVGHHGWKKEKTLRDHIAKLIKGRIAQPQGMGVSSFPQLIIGGEFSLVKANGFPYSAPLIGGMWPFLMSTSHNPLRVLLELIFTKLDALYGVRILDDSIEQEAMSSCLRARAVQLDEHSGWQYIYDDLPSKGLKARGISSQWEPVKLTCGQHVVIAQLCNELPVRLTDPDFIEFASKEDGGFDAFIQSLVMTQLIAIEGDELRLTTLKCEAICIGGIFYAGENNSGLLTKWIEHRLGKRIDESNILVIRDNETSDD
ncbi:MAG: DUF6602 domain-containing protein [Methylomicrobium sp.]